MEIFKNFISPLKNDYVVSLIEEPETMKHVRVNRIKTLKDMFVIGRYFPDDEIVPKTGHTFLHEAVI